MNYRVPVEDQKVKYEQLSQILTNNVLFGIRTNNKNFMNKYHEVRLKYTYLSAELYNSQMTDLANYLKTFYDRGLNKELLVVDRKKHYTSMLKVFSGLADFNFKSGKLIAGCLTNAQPKTHMTPSGLFILHDKKEKQIVSECIKTKTPVVGFNNLVAECSLFTRVVIINNFHKLSITYSLWFLLKKLEELGCVNQIMNYSDFRLCCQAAES